MVDLETKQSTTGIEVDSPKYSFLEKLNGTGFLITVQDDLSDADLTKIRKTEFRIEGKQSAFIRTDFTGHSIDASPTVDDVAAMFKHAQSNSVKTSAFDALSDATAKFLIQKKVHARDQESYSHVVSLEAEIFGQLNIKKSA